MDKNIVCINCPIGCYLTVTLENNAVTAVTGNSCPRGKMYAEKECTNPVRMVTSTVRIKGGDLSVLPVKTAEAIPKDKIFACIRQLSSIEITAPISVGDVVLKDVCDTGIDIVATQTVPAITNNNFQEVS